MKRKLSTANIDRAIDSYEENGGFHDEPVIAERARREVSAMKKRIKELEHEIKHWMGDCNCTKFVNP